GDRGYQIDATGNLHCIDLVNGKILWTEKLDSDNLHSSPLYVDGILYVPTNNGKFFVIRPSDEKAEILHSMELEGSCIGAPAVWKGHVYVHTTEKLYCFKLKTGDISYLEVPKEEALEMGDPNALAVIPNEMALR